MAYFQELRANSKGYLASRGALLYDEAVNKRVQAV